MKKISIISFIFAFVMSFFVFFGYLTYNSYPILYLAIAIGLIMVLKYKKRIRISLNNILWIFIGLVLFLGCIYSNAQNNAFNFSLSFFLMLVLSIICTNINDNRWFNYFVKISIVFGLIHVFGTLLYQVYPYTLDSICRKILKPGDYVMNAFLWKNGGNPGITGQTGINGWFISITIGLLCNYLFENKKRFLKILTFVLILLSIVALILTSKRSFILFSALSIVLTYITNNNDEKHGKFKRIILFLIISFFLILIISNNSQLINVFDRFVGDGTDISSGRYSLYQKMFDIFVQNPILGIGTMSVLPLLGNLGHNIYLQVLCENGLFSFILFIVAISHSYRIIKKYNLKSNINMKICSYIFLLFFLYGFTGNPLYTIQEYGLLMLVIGFINHFEYGGEKIEKE